MFEKKRLMRLGAGFDGEATEAGPAGLSETEKRHLEQIEKLRAGAAASRAATPEISDAQFGAFMAGIREGIAAPAPGWNRTRMWAYVSLAAAAMVIAVSMLYVLAPGPEPVKANKVESVSTELEGATVDWYENDKGGATEKPKGVME